ncbi:hypothetical protein HRbin02_01833 [Candidatus Calditenuaceae archaeon HR02]|nr:hypothetical protein HRbin02_01833 [Candidatus Calditenuaceae archaeon HR02]
MSKGAGAQGEDMSYRKIQERIYELFGVWLSKSQISYWCRGTHRPEGRVSVVVREGYWFRYVVGSVLSDGNRKRHAGNSDLMLRVRDREFVEAFAEALRRIGL